MTPCRRRAINAQKQASEPKEPEAFFIALPVVEMQPEKKHGRQPHNAKSKSRK